MDFKKSLPLLQYSGGSETEVSDSRAKQPDSIPVANNSTTQTEQICIKRISICFSEVADDTFSVLWPHKHTYALVHPCTRTKPLLCVLETYLQFFYKMTV